MRPCKRLEIVIERTQAPRLEAAIKTAGATGFTVIHNAGGGGDRGHRRADDVTDTDENCVFIVAVEDESVLLKIIESIRPILKRFGGVCLASEAQWLIH